MKVRSDRRDATAGPYSQRKLCDNAIHKIFVVVFKITDYNFKSLN